MTLVRARAAASLWKKRAPFATLSQLLKENALNKKSTKKLTLNRETLRQLNSVEMTRVAGGSEETFCWSFCNSCLCPLTETCKSCGGTCPTGATCFTCLTCTNNC